MTGPRNPNPNTAPPREASSRNALKHGLTSANFCLLDDEDQNLFNEHRASIELALAPRNVIEAIHVARIVETSWLIFRASLIEAKAISVSMEISKTNWLDQHPDSSDPTTTLASIGGEYLCFQALEDLETKSKVFDKLTRYRTTHERSFHRNLNALQKLRGPAKPLLEILPNNCLALLNRGQSIFDLKPPAPPAPPSSQPTDSKSEIENCETKLSPPEASPTPPSLSYS
jgi:hypothetical protein